MNNKFEDLNVWKNSFNLPIGIYENLKECRDYGFKDQIQRAAVSILSNIAEGLERNHAKETIQFLYIIKGSCGEVRAQLHIAKALEYLPSEKADNLIQDSAKISSQLYNLIQYRTDLKKPIIHNLPTICTSCTPFTPCTPFTKFTQYHVQFRKRQSFGNTSRHFEGHRSGQPGSPARLR